jgi:hypothetical protein
MAIISGWRRYLFEYRHNNSEWAIEIIAESPEDARERLKAITWARYKGEIVANISVPNAGGALSRLASWLSGK